MSTRVSLYYRTHSTQDIWIHIYFEMMDCRHYIEGNDERRPKGQEHFGPIRVWGWVAHLLSWACIKYLGMEKLP